MSMLILFHNLSNFLVISNKYLPLFEMHDYNSFVFLLDELSNEVFLWENYSVKQLWKHACFVTVYQIICSLLCWILSNIFLVMQTLDTQHFVWFLHFSLELIMFNNCKYMYFSFVHFGSIDVYFQRVIAKEYVACRVWY